MPIKRLLIKSFAAITVAAATLVAAAGPASAYTGVWWA